MQLIFAEAVAVVLGLAVHAALPRRSESGVLLLPAIAGVACALVWTALTWSGVRDGSGEQWLAALLAALIAPVAVGVPLRRNRHRRDELRLRGL